MESIKFSTYQLIVNEQHVDFDSLAKELADSVASDLYEKNDSYYDFKCQSVPESQCIWLYANYGKPNPRPDYVKDIRTGDETTNPRQKTQLEPTGQLFVLYSHPMQTLYIFPSNKKKLVSDYLSETLDAKIIIKSRYLTLEEFIKKIKLLDRVRFTGSRDLFNRDGDLFNSLNNIFGFGAPERFEIKAEYKEHINDSLKNKIRSLFRMSQAHQFDSLIMIGKDESHIDAIYNSSEFVQQIEVRSNKDNQGLFQQDKILKELLRKIGNFNNVQAA